MDSLLLIGESRDEVACTWPVENLITFLKHTPLAYLNFVVKVFFEIN